ncbi:MAG TPA: YetF domain-containing protein, partial [Pedobacter sp.]|nr:YetF domain-containing protein [Pedobacter sp.]
IPLMNPDRGLLPAFVVAAVLILYQIVIAKKASVDKKFESITQDKYNMLVKDGVLNTDAMLLTRISRDRVFSQLRSHSISHLGMVKRLYFEAGGTFSVLSAAEPKPGLSVIPAWDSELSTALHMTGNGKVCSYCGKENPSGSMEESVSCLNCRNKDWVAAVTNRD